MTAVISVRLKNVQFEGQTKTKLGNPEVKPLVEQLVSQKLDEFLNLKSSKSIAEKIVEKAMGAARTRDNVRRAKELSRQQKSINNANLVGKLASCTGKNPNSTNCLSSRAIPQAAAQSKVATALRKRFYPFAESR